VLWDKHRATIVNNESSEIIRMLSSAFDEWGDASRDFYPRELRGEIDRINAFVYPNVNNGVYRCGFATTQAAYEEAFGSLFAALDDLEQRLSRTRYIAGARITEADWRLFTTLVRFDAVYHGHFKCNLRRIVDYPNLWNYLRELYQVPGVAETVDLAHQAALLHESSDDRSDRDYSEGSCDRFQRSEQSRPNYFARLGGSVATRVETVALTLHLGKSEPQRIRGKRQCGECQNLPVITRSELQRRKL
jgi:glutathione S-transferase